MSQDPAVVAATDHGRRSFRNFSRNRPETTNLNHQQAIRRAFIGSSLLTGVAALRRGLAQAPSRAYDLLHNRPRKREAARRLFSPIPIYRPK